MYHEDFVLHKKYIPANILQNHFCDIFQQYCQKKDLDRKKVLLPRQVLLLSAQNKDFLKTLLRFHYGFLEHQHLHCCYYQRKLNLEKENHRHCLHVMNLHYIHPLLVLFHHLQSRRRLHHRTNCTFSTDYPKQMLLLILC